MRSAGPAFELIERAAIRTSFLTGFFDWQVHAWMGVPQQHVRHRAVQGQLRGINLDAALLIFFEFAHPTSQMCVSQS